jgi:ABC-type microcin C transport system permease subunit YejE
LKISKKSRRNFQWNLFLQEITEYVIKELAKTNKDNVQKFVYDNKEYVKKKFDAASRKLYGKVENPDKYEIKIVRTEEISGQYSVYFTIRNKTAKDNEAQWRNFVEDRKNWSREYDHVFTYQKENGKWKVFLLY